jgi:hypothetical protein
MEPKEVTGSEDEMEPKDELERKMRREQNETADEGADERFG